MYKLIQIISWGDVYILRQITSLGKRSTTCHGKPAASVTTPEVPVTTPEPVPSVLDMQRLSSRSSSSTVASLDESLPVTTPRDHLPVLLAPLPTLHGGGCLLYPFNNVSSPAGQIHHTGHHHWVTSVSCNNHVYLLDSMSNGRLTTSLEIQLAALYNIGTNVLTVKIPSIQQQENSHDCGLFAIANLVQFCYGMYTGKEHVMFNTSYMRDHLVFCLERQFFVPFPRVQTKIKVNRKKPTIVLIQCDCLCRQSNSMESMVGCDWGNGTCDVWKHKTCAQRQNQEEDWFCSPHRHQ